MIEFQTFKNDITTVSLPKAFTFPFYYEPHELSKLAMVQLQDELSQLDENAHNFGLNAQDPTPPIGKMFGVLVVKDQQNNIGFLKAYSGELQGEKLSSFVPPIVSKNYKNNELQTKNKVEVLNHRIELLEKSNDYLTDSNQLMSMHKEFEENFKRVQNQYKEDKIKRKSQREQSRNLDEDERNKLLSALAKKSSSQKGHLRFLKKQFSLLIKPIEQRVEAHLNTITQLKHKRAITLAELQTSFETNLFFNNSNNEQLSLHEIFKRYHNKKPNVGTGECCAPKLLNFAFNNNLTPIAMSEFWWGAPHKNNIRKHKYIYPACTARCAPLLKHMLKNISLEQDPIKINYGKDKIIKKIFEDDYLLIINKPPGLLSTPGKYIEDSVQTRIKKEYSRLSYIMPVHRLDQGTSGILILAKSRRIHGILQKQFLLKKIKKTYEALIQGAPTVLNGLINLPIIMDCNNPPFQMVSLKLGKPSTTEYKVLKQNSYHSLVELNPLTGRTHQLRVHCAHQDGLNCPILGDDMYGIKDTRMFLHASKIEFFHPETREFIKLTSPSLFELN